MRENPKFLTNCLVLTAFFALQDTAAAVAQGRPGIGAYPSAPLGSPPPVYGSPPAQVAPPLQDKADDYCRANPSACAVKPPDTGQVILQQQKERQEKDRQDNIDASERESQSQQKK